MSRRAGCYASGVVALVALALVGCDEDQGPQVLLGRLAIVPMFENADAADLPVRTVNVRVSREDATTLVRDTTVTLQGTEDSVDIRLSVTLTRQSEPFVVRLTLRGAGGDTLFVGQGRAVAASAGAPVPGIVPLTYVGVGANAVTASILTRNPVVAAAGSVELTAVALDGAGQPIPGTPIIWRTTDTTVATFPNRHVGTLVSKGPVAQVAVIARLVTGPADTTTARVVASIAGVVQAAIDSLERALFVLIDRGIEDPLGTRRTALNWSALDGVSFRAARDLFQQALAAQPGNQKAALGLAAATLGMLEDDLRLRGYAEPWDVWQSMFDYGATDSLFQGPGPYPPTLADAQPVLRDVVKPALIQALAPLSGIDSAAFTFTVTARMRGELPTERVARELDLTDVYFIRAGLEAGIAAINVALSYRLDPSPYGPSGLGQALAPASTFFTLAAGAGPLLAEAQQRLLTAAGLARQAFDLLVAETDSQADDLVRYDPQGESCCIYRFADVFDFPLTPADVADARRVLNQLTGSLNGPFTFTEDFGRGTVNLVIDASRVFLGVLTNLKTFWPAYVTDNGRLRWTALAFDEWTFPDPTFANVLPGIPSTDSLKQTVDLESIYYDANYYIEGWSGLTQGPADGDLFAGTWLGYLREVAADFSAQTDRPNLPVDPLDWGTQLSALARNTAGGELIAVTNYGSIYTRPDDAATPWTLRFSGFVCCAPILVANPAGSGFFALTDNGELWQIPADYSTALDRPDLFYYVTGFTANDSTGELAAVSWDGLVFSRMATDVTGPWAQRLSLPFLNWEEQWAGIVQHPSASSLFVITRRGDLKVIDAALTTVTDRPKVPATNVRRLGANRQTGELLALTEDGRVFTRPPDATTPWTLRTTLPRRIVNQPNTAAMTSSRCQGRSTGRC